MTAHPWKRTINLRTKGTKQESFYSNHATKSVSPTNSHLIIHRTGLNAELKKKKQKKKTPQKGWCILSAHSKHCF